MERESNVAQAGLELIMQQKQALNTDCLAAAPEC